MPFCPKCRYEYESRVSRCPDCEETLVSHLPPEEPDKPDLPEDFKEWVQVARLTSNQYAQLLVSAFRSSGIPVVVQGGTGHFGMTGQDGTSLFLPSGGGYSVYVPEGHVVAADIEGAGILGDIWESSKLIDIDDAEDVEDDQFPDER